MFNEEQKSLEEMDSEKEGISGKVLTVLITFNNVVIS
jgi:hypothetical protein